MEQIPFNPRRIYFPQPPQWRTRGLNEADSPLGQSNPPTPPAEQWQSSGAFPAAFEINYAPPKAVCKGCIHYCGNIYRDVPFVCAVHPYGTTGPCRDAEYK